MWPRRPGEASWPMPWAACCLRPPSRSLFEPSVQLFLLPMPALGPCAVSGGSGGSAAQQAALVPDSSRTAAKRLCAVMLRLSAATAEVLLDYASCSRCGCWTAVRLPLHLCRRNRTNPEARCAFGPHHLQLPAEAWRTTALPSVAFFLLDLCAVRFLVCVIACPATFPYTPDQDSSAPRPFRRACPLRAAVTSS